MSAANRYAGGWLPAALSRIPGLRRQFDLTRDPYIAAQLRDSDRSEQERRDGRGSAMVETDRLAVDYRPPPSLARAIDRQDFNQRWMMEQRDSVFAQVAARRRQPEPDGPERQNPQPPSTGRQLPEKENEMADYIKINGDEHLHINAIRRLRVMTDKERESLSRLGSRVNADRFNTRIDEPGGRKSYAPETIDEIAAQGVDLVEVDNGAFVPAQNIGKVRDITEKDRAGFEARTGRQLGDGFKSRIETRSGMVLSTYDSAAVMERIGRPYQPQDGQTRPGKSRDIAQERDTVMAKAANKPNSPGNQPQPEM